jgi:hypothetical protein
MIRVLTGLAFGCALVVGSGCSKTGGGVGSGDQQETTLREVADLIRATTQPNGKGPARVADFEKLQSTYYSGYQAVKSGDVVVIWGAGMKGEGATGSGGEVIAYEKDAPNNGGFVLLNSGEVKKMSAGEFNSAPKAK